MDNWDNTMMNLVHILQNDVGSIDQKTFYLLGNTADEWAFDGFKSGADDDKGKGVYVALFNQETIDKTLLAHQAVLLTADNTPDDIDVLKPYFATLQAVYFYVADFKDGRVFSLVKHLRNQGFDADIYIAGEFGLDQANYFVKSGASGFIVNDDKIDTLKHTLKDLKSAHFGQSVSALPMFR